MKNILFIVMAFILTVAFANAAGSKKAIPFKPGFASEKLVTTYATAVTDTIIITRDPAAAAYSFSCYTADTSNITSAVVYRVADGKVMAVAAGDTLLTYDSTLTAKLRIKTVTLAPLADQYFIIVKYKSNTSGYDQGVTTPAVTYEAIKQYSK